MGKEKSVDFFFCSRKGEGRKWKRKNRCALYNLISARIGVSNYRKKKGVGTSLEDALMMLVEDQTKGIHLLVKAFFSSQWMIVCLVPF